MDIQELRSKITAKCDATEEIFLDLADKFPKLLNKQTGSIDEMRVLFDSLEKDNENISKKEHRLFDGFGGKYDKLFDSLNNKIKDLENVNNQVLEIKTYSEEMELIALNAMVISIKSGEKGRAFSTITDNLKRLSADMILYSNKLIEEENNLMDLIKSVKDVFSNIISKQRTLASLGESGASGVRSMIQNVNAPLSEISTSSSLVYSPIQKAIEGLQLQDIVRQSLDHVQTCLNEYSDIDRYAAGSDEQLDGICYNIELLQLAHSVLDDINNNLNKAINTFDSNWNNVHGILEQVEESRKDFLMKFLDENSMNENNIPHQLKVIVMRFQEILDNFGKYQSVQKDLVRLCQSITEKARTMYSVFENLRPVVSRLHHVRILQGIEVNKNTAIESVKDSVNDMDNLINSANIAIDAMHTVLEGFLTEIGKLLGDFTTSINKDNEGMKNLRDSKNSFFNSLKDAQDRMGEIFRNFVVFPDSFNQQCNEVVNDIKGMHKIIAFFKSTINDLDAETGSLEHKRNDLLAQRGIENWDIRSGKFRNIIQRFTITAHKEAAGKIGGFAITKGAAEGDVTFF